jgi:hypothetical protein
MLPAEASRARHCTRSLVKTAAARLLERPEMIKAPDRQRVLLAECRRNVEE